MIRALLLLEKRVASVPERELPVVMKRPSYLKKQKEQQRRAKATEKREARRARQRAKAERPEGGEGGSLADEFRELPTADEEATGEAPSPDSNATEPGNGEMRED